MNTGTVPPSATLPPTCHPKLIHGLSCFLLSAAERRCSNGFHNRCLRSITGISSSLLSRVPNSVAQHRANCIAACDMFVRCQLLFFRKVLRSPPFLLGAPQPATSRYIGRVARSRQESNVYLPATRHIKLSEATRCRSLRPFANGNTRCETCVERRTKSLKSSCSLLQPWSALSIGPAS